jgi:hypothetical protein
MSYKTHHHHRDKNHLEIVNALQSIGATVFEMKELDLIASLRPDGVCLIEIKPDSGKIAYHQIVRLATAKFYRRFIYDAESAIAFVSEPSKWSYTAEESDRLLQMAQRLKTRSKDANPRMSVGAFEKEFNS